MANKNQQALQYENGAAVIMPPWFQGAKGWGNLDLPDVYAADDNPQQYPEGSVFVEGNRKFNYGRYRGVVTSVGSSVTQTNGDDLAGKFLFTYAHQVDMANGLLVQHLAGEESMWYITTPTAQRFDDYLSGGWVCGKDTTPSDERMFHRRILAHNYSAALVVGGTARTLVSELQLDRPIINSKTSMATTFMGHEYKYILWQNDTGYATYRGCIGAAMHNDPSYDRWGWYQVKGEMFCPHVHAATVGAAANERVVILMADGSVQVRESTYDYMDSHYGVIGHIMGDTTFLGGSGADEGLPMIFVDVPGR